MGLGDAVPGKLGLETSAAPPLTGAPCSAVRCSAVRRRRRPFACVRVTERWTWNSCTVGRRTWPWRGASRDGSAGRAGGWSPRARLSLVRSQPPPTVRRRWRARVSVRACAVCVCFYRAGTAHAIDGGAHNNNNNNNIVIEFRWRLETWSARLLFDRSRTCTR